MLRRKKKGLIQNFEKVFLQYFCLWPYCMTCTHPTFNFEKKWGNNIISAYSGSPPLVENMDIDWKGHKPIVLNIKVLMYVIDNEWKNCKIFLKGALTNGRRGKKKLLTEIDELVHWNFFSISNFSRQKKDKKGPQDHVRILETFRFLKKCLFG